MKNKTVTMILCGQLSVGGIRALKASNGARVIQESLYDGESYNRCISKYETIATSEAEGLDPLPKGWRYCD